MSDESKFNFVSTSGALSAAALLTGNKKAAAAFGTIAAVGSTIRKIASGLSGVSDLQFNPKVQATWAEGNKDWRVRLSLPSGDAYSSSPLLSPLYEAGLNALIFPYTPTVTMTHTANYNSLDVTHSNYPFLSYQNSKVEQITITGTFYCETGVDAAYWVAAVHYLRSVTKMAFGDSGGDTGQPPPVVKLNGYGDYVFNNLPVVVKSFTLDLPNDVDYIQARVDATEGLPEPDQIKTAYAPAKSTITVVLLPVYSRTQQRQFNLNDFVTGEYVLGTTDTTTGFI